MMTEYGYYFHPSKHPQDIGHPQLDVNLYAASTKDHFDAEHLIVWLVDKRGQVYETTIKHPWLHSTQAFHLAPGRISIRDRKDKKVEAFSLGGKLQIDTHKDHTHCAFTSEAPIMKLTDPQSTEAILVSEFEILLAKAQAKWSHHDSFRTKLASIEPLVLLSSGILSIKTRLKRLPRTATRQKTEHALNEAVRILQEDGRLITSVPPLDELLSPPNRYG